MRDSEIISVIIPAYNVDKYVRKCLDSVINQTYKNLDIILVNDGSTDNTGHIYDEYASNDTRITVIHQKNGGLSSARNAGLEIAKGEWIAFLDSDDWISLDMYESLLNAAKEYNADIASCKTHECPLSQEPKDFIDTDSISVLTPLDMIAGLYTQEVVRFEVWNKLWKRSLIGDTRFIPGQVSEDVHFDRILFLRANKMVHIDRTLHHYLVNRPGSTLSSFKIGRMCVFEEFDLLIKDLTNNQGEALIPCIATIASHFAMTMFDEATISKQTDQIRNNLIKQFRHFYPMYKRTKYNGSAEKLFNISPRLYYMLLTINRK